MLRALTSTAVLRCVHGGQVVLPPKPDAPVGFGGPTHHVLCERDLVNREIVCPAPPDQNCKRILSVTDGLYAGWTIDGSPVVTELAVGKTASPGGWFVFRADPDAPVVHARGRGSRGGAGGKKNKNTSPGEAPEPAKKRNGQQCDITIIDLEKRPLSGLSHTLACGNEESTSVTDAKGKSTHRLSDYSSVRVRVGSSEYDVPLRPTVPTQLAKEFVSPSNGLGELLWQVTPVRIALDGDGVVAKIDPPPGDQSGVSAVAGAVARWTERDIDYHRTFPHSLLCATLRQACMSYWDVSGGTRRAADRSLRLVLQQVPVEFVYMDCGRWGGDGVRNRHFGLVWRNVAVLCAFRRGGPEPAPPTPPRGRFFTRWLSLGTGRSGATGNKPQVREQTGIRSLDTVLAGLEGGGYYVEVVGQLQARGVVGLQEPAADKVHVILPDLHLPVATRPPEDLKAALGADGRVFMNPWPPRFPVGLGAFGVEVLREGRWYELYRDSVIFGSGEPDGSLPAPGTAAGDLLAFLDRLERLAAGGEPVHFIQLGDLYELWTGLDWYCDATPSFREVVELARGERNGIDARRFVRHWMERIRGCFPTLVGRIESLGRAMPSTLLHGNHDQYLIRPDCLPDWMAARLPDYRHNGLYVEHGHNHRADPINRDGSPDGHEGATKYFFDHNVKHVVPNPRKFHLGSAVQQFCESPDFSVYVMGHTHSPFLTRVQLVSAIRYPVPPPLASPAPTSPPQGAEVRNGVELSGETWWHANQGRFPNSNRVEDLAPPFRERVEAFLDALRRAGVAPRIRSTRRSEARAYLMHYSWKIAKGQVHPKRVRPHPAVNIVWDHGDLAKSRKAARDMVRLFEMVHPAALDSNHIRGWAIDMSLSWDGTVSIPRRDGTLKVISGRPRNHRNKSLHAVGKTYGVYKLVTDDPHWSIDGR